MIPMLSPIVAQAAAAPEEITAGGVITAVMFLVTVIGSIGMIVHWLIRYSQTGDMLPSARRGVLRVPWPLTLAGVALSVVFMLLMLFGSVAEISNVNTSPVVAKTITDKGIDAAQDETNRNETQDVTNPAAEPNSTDKDSGVEVADDASKTAESIREADKGAAGNTVPDPSKSAGISPQQMRASLIQTIVMDLFLLLSFGVVVLLASQSGRVYLPGPKGRNHQTLSGQGLIQGDPIRAAGAGIRFDPRWPDLNDASAIPQIQGYEILGNRAAAGPERAATEKAAEFLASQQSSTPQPSREERSLDEPNPFSYKSPGPKSETIPLADEAGAADEQFSFVRELRYAAEVFLAAYLPISALKLVIVLISMSIFGEPPKSHPFLEMLDAGVSVTMIAMILIMAVIVAPIVEELQFRVVVLGGIAQLGRPKLALFTSSILFAFAHGFPDSIALIPLAIALGYTYLRRRSYVTVMLVHFLFNGFNMILALLALL